MHFRDGETVLEHRKGLDRSQTAFWSPLGITQSGGSRYESGRTIPKPVQLLLELAYGSEEQSAAVASALRNGRPIEKRSLPDEPDAMSPGEKILIALWRQADERLQKAILAVAKLAK